MQRRDFLRTAALATAGAAVMGTAAACGKKEENKPRAYKVGGIARMKLSWERYELKLAHVFTVASYSRTTTPDIQVKSNTTDTPVTARPQCPLILARPTKA